MDSRCAAVALFLVVAFPVDLTWTHVPLHPPLSDPPHPAPSNPPSSIPPTAAARTERLLFHDQLSRLEDKLSQMEAKLSQQEAKLSQQEVKLSQQEAKLSRQEAKLSQQEAKLSQQEEPLGELAAEAPHRKAAVLSRTHGPPSLSTATLRQHSGQSLLPETAVSRESTNVDPHQRVSDHQGPAQPPEAPTTFPGSQNTLLPTTLKNPFPRFSVNVTDVANDPSGASSRKRTTTTSGHDVRSRSDDAGPLETVVSHLGLQVSELSAGLQALKTQTSADVQGLRTTASQQGQEIQEARTSVYVQWGRSSCSFSSSQLAYAGAVGGSWMDHSGGATNYLCLTMSPTPGRIHASSYVALLYGAEYQTFDSHQDHDPVCAVCRSAFATTLMIPGTDACVAGWQKLYSGYLMAGRYTHGSGSQYICVDSSLESATHSIADENGRELFYTVTRCGSLPCGPYANNAVVTCVVCGK